MISMQGLRLYYRSRTCAFKEFCDSALTYLYKVLLYTCCHIFLNAHSFIWGTVMSAVQLSGTMALGSAGGSKVCVKLTGTEVKDYSCKSEYGCQKLDVQKQPKRC